MAQFTITVPDPLVPDMLLMADELLTAWGIDYSEMTNAQKGKRVVAELLKQHYIAFKRRQAEGTANETIQNGVQGAKTDAEGIN
jgi:hypothetical protein